MSWEIGLALLALVGIGTGIASAFIGNLRTRWSVLILVPLVTPTALYWALLPPEGLWSEHWNWAPVFILPWTLCGLGFAFTSFALCRYIRGRSAHDSERKAARLPDK